MILLCGIPSEPPLARVAAAVEALGERVEWFHQRHADLYSLSTGCETDAGQLLSPGCRVDLAAITGVYVRLMDVTDLPEAKSPPRAARMIENHDRLVDWLESTETLVLNRLSTMASNGSKPYQAQRIAAAGFLVPRTLVTNDPAKVQAFRAAVGRVIFKSTSAVRSIVRELDDAASKDLERVRVLPTQFQEYIAGTDIRVHVVGDRLFATEIASSAMDYRYARTDNLEATMREVELPTEIADRCRAVSVALELPLCGIDLRRTPEDEYYCFEVNPSPAFSYYEDGTGQPIADAIARRLSGGPQ